MYFVFGSFSREAIADTAKDSILVRSREFEEKTEAVASAAKLLVFPLAAARAAFHMAYVMLRCVALFAGQCWSRSHVSESQRRFLSPYPRVDFDFWVKYGSWSQCLSCGSFHFNDRYFRQFVYQSQGTSAKPDKLAAYRRQVPRIPWSMGQVMWVSPRAGGISPVCTSLRRTARGVRRQGG